MQTPTEAALRQLRESNEVACTMAFIARVLGVDERTVSGAVQRGELPGVRLGRRVLIPREPFLALFTAGSTSSSTPENSRARDWVLGYLSARGVAPEAQVLADADAAGIAPSEAHRAAESLGVPRQVAAGRGVCWSFPPASQTAAVAG